MTPEELKVKSAEIDKQIIRLEQTESEFFSELGRKLLPLVPPDSEYAPLIEKIKEISDKTAELRQEKISIDEEYQNQLAAVTCFYCKAVSAEGSRFCEECGAKLGVPPREYCKACGTTNAPNMKFCGECGNKLDEIKTETAIAN